MEIGIPLFDGLSLKIGCSPNERKPYPTDRLQKGLLLWDEGCELAEEAVGFGVPLLKRGLETIFPGNVVLTCRERGSTWKIDALFTLNLVEKLARGGNEIVQDGLSYEAKNLLAAVMRRVPMLRRPLTTISSNLRQMFDWETTYVGAGLSVDVKLMYTVEEETGEITVEVDTGGLPREITEVEVMNEQGAHHFDRYLDASGISLQGEEIGCWDEVNAQEAWFESNTRQVAFRLGRVRGARLFRGRELVGSRLAWAGFGYSFPPSLNGLRYAMRIERLA